MTEDLSDPYGVWARLMGGEPYSTFAELGAAYWRYQSRFDAQSGLRCSGIVSLKPNVKVPLNRYCASPICPGCWHKTQLAIMETVQKFQAPYWYVRYTNEVEIGQFHHPKVMKRFKAHTTDYKMLAWVAACDMYGGTEADGLGGTVIRPDTGFYRYIGILTSEKPVRNWAVAYDAHNGDRIEGVLFEDSSKQVPVGSVTTKAFEDVDSALYEWEQQNQHPGVLSEHPSLYHYVHFLHELGHSRFLRKPAEAVRTV